MLVMSALKIRSCSVLSVGTVGVVAFNCARRRCGGYGLERRKYLVLALVEVGGALNFLLADISLQVPLLLLLSLSLLIESCSSCPSSAH